MGAIEPFLRMLDAVSADKGDFDVELSTTIVEATGISE